MEQVELKTLLARYYGAANALVNYREREGFNPGVKVACKFQDNPVKVGVIEQYGDAWSRCQHFQVPVRLEGGVLQPWGMDDITIIP